MKSPSFALVTACLLVTLTYASANIFSRSCPPFCADTSCTRMGCTECRPGYFADFSTGFGFCRSSCPPGYFGHPLGFCTQCRDRNCLTCEDRNTCTGCKQGYEVGRFGYCDRVWRG